MLYYYVIRVYYNENWFYFSDLTARFEKERYNLFPVAENTNGYKRNGTWYGIVGAVVKGVKSLNKFVL